MLQEQALQSLVWGLKLPRGPQFLVRKTPENQQRTARGGRQQVAAEHFRDAINAQALWLQKAQPKAYKNLCRKSAPIASRLSPAPLHLGRGVTDAPL